MKKPAITEEADDKKSHWGHAISCNIDMHSSQIEDTKALPLSKMATKGDYFSILKGCRSDLFIVDRMPPQMMGIPRQQWRVW
ncbi:hypothetical protein ACN5PQ_002409 [Cronobacter turicensis]